MRIIFRAYECIIYNQSNIVVLCTTLECDEISSEVNPFGNSVQKGY